MSKKYNIVFSGKITDNSDIDTVKTNLSGLLKKSIQNIDALFSGKPVVFKKNIDLEAAEKFKTVLEKKGALCEIREVSRPSDVYNLEMENNACVEQPDNSIEKISCPNCNFMQALSDECRKCGIIFSKYQKKEMLEELSPEDLLSKASEDDQLNAKAQFIAMTYNMASKKRLDFKQLFKWIRIGVLFLVLFVAAVHTTMTSDRISSWENPLKVVIYPLNGDQSDETSEYIDMLDPEDFKPVEMFMMEEAERYNFKLKKPVTVDLAPEINILPPEIPADRNPFIIMWWSLKMRYWAFRNNTYDDEKDIRLFVIYKRIRSSIPQMEVSAGLRKGLMGLIYTSPHINAKDYSNIVITHEMLHTFGATDKYDYRTFAPAYPDGYADPERDPLYPQDYGEIMAVRIPESEKSFYIPRSLDDLIIGEKTSVEINWVEE